MLQTRASVLGTLQSTQSRSSSVSIVTRLQAGRLGFNYWQVQGIFLFTTMSRPTLEPSLSPIQWVLWSVPWWKSFWVVKLTSHIHVMLRLRMH